MSQEVILCNRGDEHEIIEEEKVIWIRDVLMAIGVPESIIEDEDGMVLKHYLDAHAIDVWQNLEDGSAVIQRDDKLIGEWKYPKLTLKQEARNKWYYEIRLNEWAVPFQMKERR